MKLAIYGAGAVGIEIKEIAEFQGTWDEIIFIEDSKKLKTFRKLKCFTFADFKKKYKTDEIKIVIGVGDPKVRKIIYDKVKKDGYKLANVIHPNSYISKDALIKEGVVVEMESYIGFDADIGDNVLISAGSIIAHNCILKPHTTVLGATIAGGCTIGESALLGMGCIIRERTNVGDKALISMGSIVFDDVPSNMIVMGNPARIIGENTGKPVFK